MEEKTCRECKHYYQHYTLFPNGEFRAIDCGHCATPRLKSRKPGTEACLHWEEIPEQTEETPS